jgi:hypothetical protein
LVLNTCSSVVLYRVEVASTVWVVGLETVRYSVTVSYTVISSVAVPSTVLVPPWV